MNTIMDLSDNIRTCKPIRNTPQWPFIVRIPAEILDTTSNRRKIISPAFVHCTRITHDPEFIGPRVRSEFRNEFVDKRMCEFMKHDTIIQ